MLYHLTLTTAAEQLNTSALPHAPQVEDDISEGLLQRGLRSAGRVISPLLAMRAR